MIITRYVIIFGIYCSPFLALAIPLLGLFYKKAVYCYSAAIFALPYALWFGVGGNLHQAAAIPVLLCLMGLAISRKPVIAWTLYGLQSALIISILVASAYY